MSHWDKESERNGKFIFWHFFFVLIADNIGQIKIPVGTGMFILFPIFYAIILGVVSGPQVLKIVENKHVKAASKLVVVGIAAFYCKAWNYSRSQYRNNFKRRSCSSAPWLRKLFWDFPCAAGCYSSGNEKRGGGSLLFH